MASEKKSKSKLITLYLHKTHRRPCRRRQRFASGRQLQSDALKSMQSMVRCMPNPLRYNAVIRLMKHITN